MRFNQNSSRYSREKGKPFLPIDLSEFVDQYMDSVPRYYIHLSEVDWISIKISPKGYGDTPVGLYAYPLTMEIYRKWMDKTLPYLMHMPFISLLEHKSPESCLDLADDKNKQLYQEIKMELGLAGSMNDTDRAQLLHKLIRRHGFNSVVSYNGEIHRNEPVQAVFLISTSFKIIGSFLHASLRPLDKEEIKRYDKNQKQAYAAEKATIKLANRIEQARITLVKKIKTVCSHYPNITYVGVEECSGISFKHPTALNGWFDYSIRAWMGGNYVTIGYFMLTTRPKEIQRGYELEGIIVWIDYKFLTTQVANKLAVSAKNAYLDLLFADSENLEYDDNYSGYSWEEEQRAIEEQEDEDYLVQDDFLPKRKGKLKKEGLIRHALYNPAPKAAKFSIYDLNPDQRADLYEVFKTSYIQATGNAWSNSLFNRRAENWTFYGIIDGVRTGVVAIRTQRSGLNKLVAIAGHPRSALAGIKLLMSDKQNEPIWGMISADLVPMARRMGLLTAHDQAGGPAFMRAVLSMIPAEVFGDSQIELLPDGGISVNVAEVGTVTKYLVFNKAYLHTLVKQAMFMLPAAVPMIQMFTAKLMFGGK